MIKKLLNSQINSITAAAFLIGFFSIVSRLLGVFRSRILAGEFGAGQILDVYYASFRIPDLVYNLLVLGAISAGFIPIFSRLLKDHEETKGKENDAAWDFASRIFNIIGLALIIVSFLAIIFTPFVVKILAPGFSPEASALTIKMSRIMFLSPIFLGFSSVVGGVLQSFKRFFVYSLAPIVYNIGIILGALYLVPIIGPTGLAWGVALGALLHLTIQLPSVFSLGFKYKLVFGWADSNIRKIAKMMLPRTMSLAIAQINLVVITIIASTLETGSLSVFNFANDLQSFPIGLFGISFAIAAFPKISQVSHDVKEMVKNFSHTVRQILFFIVPSSVLLLTLRAQIIRVVLGTGNFDWHDTIRTIDALGFFIFGMFALAIVPLLVRMFYAREDSLTPFLIGLFSVAVNVVLSLTLPKISVCNQIIGENGLIESQCGPMGVSGLALAFSLANIVNFILLWLILRHKLGTLDQARIVKSTAKFSLAAIGAGLAIQLAKLAIWPLVDMSTFLGIMIQGAAAGAAGILIYAFLCWVLRSEEFLYLYQAIKNRLVSKLKKNVELGDSGEARGV